MQERIHSAFPFFTAAAVCGRRDEIEEEKGAAAVFARSCFFALSDGTGVSALFFQYLRQDAGGRLSLQPYPDAGNYAGAEEY